MTTGEDRKEDGVKNWQQCSVGKLSFCDHRAIKLVQNQWRIYAKWRL